jgi:hypothetical protein
MLCNTNVLSTCGDLGILILEHEIRFDVVDYHIRAHAALLLNFNVPRHRSIEWGNAGQDAAAGKQTNVGARRILSAER